MSNKGSAYGQAAGDTDFRKKYDLDEYAAWLRARGSGTTDAAEKPRKPAPAAHAHAATGSRDRNSQKTGKNAKKKRKAG